MIILWSSIVFSQILKIDSDIKAIFLPQGYVLESISGYGYSNATKLSISNIASGNPASLLDIQKLSLGFSIQLDSDIKEAWLAQIGHKRIDNDLPQSFGIIIPIWKFKIGYGFNQKYNTELIWEKMELTTVSQPEGTGEYFIPIRKTYVTTNSIIASYALYHDKTVLSIGAQYSRNKLYHIQQIWHSNLNHNDKKDSWLIGFRYDKPTKYQIGLFFEKGLAFKKLSQINNSIEQDTLFELIANISDQFYIVGNLPDKIHLGNTYNISQEIQFVGNSTYIFWNQISDNSKDQIEFSGSIIYRLNSTATLSAGFHHTNRRYNEDSLFNSETSLKAIYLIGGLILNFRIVDIELIIADSHMLSGDLRKQTIGKLGFGIHL